MAVDASTVSAVVAALNIAITIGGGGFFAGVLTGKVKRIETDVRETKGLLVTLTNYVRTTGVAGNFTASDHIRAECVGY